MRLVVFAFVLEVSFLAQAGILPGFKLEKVASTRGFLTSIAFDSADRLHYTVTAGKVYRIDSGETVEVASVNTAAEGNAALLGIAFRHENEMVLHYVTPDLTADIIEVRDLVQGGTVESHRLACNSENRPCSTEHHGGNPITTTEGTIFVGLGDNGGPTFSQNPSFAAGKIFRIPRRGQPQMIAQGFRNPFDLAFDPELGKLIVPDNGPFGEDEINLIEEGDNAGWPMTMGKQTPVEGMAPPIFTFAKTVAPTGILLLDGKGPRRLRGFLLGSFVTKALYYFPDVLQRPMQSPVEILSEEAGAIIDVAQDSKGEVFIGSGMAIYRLVFPTIGDADADGDVDRDDLKAVSQEIFDRDGSDTFRAHEGAYRASWGADVNLDGVIDARDLVALAKMRPSRNRAVRP